MHQLSKASALAQRLAPFIEKRGNAFVPRRTLEMSEINYRLIRDINEDALRTSTAETFGEEFLLHEVGIASQAVRDAFEEFLVAHGSWQTAPA